VEWSVQEIAPLASFVGAKGAHLDREGSVRLHLGTELYLRREVEAGFWIGRFAAKNVVTLQETGRSLAGERLFCEQESCQAASESRRV
jgi:hypothetical protein